MCALGRLDALALDSNTSVPYGNHINNWQKHCNEPENSPAFGQNNIRYLDPKFSPRLKNV